MSTGTPMRFARFIAVGGLNTAFGFIAYAALLALGLHYAVAVALATVLGVLFNFRSYGALVFGHPGPGRLPRFVLVYALLYGLNVAGIGLLGTVGLSALPAGLAMLLPVAAVGYLLNSRFVFGSDRT